MNRITSVVTWNALYKHLIFSLGKLLVRCLIDFLLLCRFWGRCFIKLIFIIYIFRFICEPSKKRGWVLQNLCNQNETFLQCSKIHNISSYHNVSMYRFLTQLVLWTCVQQLWIYIYIFVIKGEEWDFHGEALLNILCVYIYIIYIWIVSVYYDYCAFSLATDIVLPWRTVLLNINTEGEKW
jgi:hypothetical protein